MIMIKIRGKLQSAVFDLPVFGKTARTRTEITLRNAARAFIRAAVVKVPVQSGMARGTFLNLSRVLRFPQIQINPVENRRIRGKYVGPLSYYWDGGPTKIVKTPEEGARRATPDDEIFGRTGDIFFFDYGNSVWHYNLNEFLGGHSPTAPWFSYEAGRAAAEEYIRLNLLRRFPKIPEFITYKTYTLDSSGVRASTEGHLSNTSAGDEE